MGNFIFKSKETGTAQVKRKLDTESIEENENGKKIKIELLNNKSEDCKSSSTEESRVKSPKDEEKKKFTQREQGPLDDGVMNYKQHEKLENPLEVEETRREEYDFYF